MKVFFFFGLFLISYTLRAQNIDYLSIRKKNGRVVKNFYTGSIITLQLTDGAYLQGPIEGIKNDSLFIVLYDVREVPTIWATRRRDTISTTVIGIHYEDIKRIQLKRSKSFIERTVAPLLMVGGASYLGLNLINGAIYKHSITDDKNLQKLAVAGGIFGIGYILKKLFSTDGFTTKAHLIQYRKL